MIDSQRRGNGHSRPIANLNGRIGRSESSCVLVIDDDMSVRRVFEHILVDAGYDFVGADNARHGIRIAQRCRPAVAIVDLRLPDTSGIDVLSAIRSLSPLTVSVLLTGFWDIKAEFEAKRAGAWACLAKPILREELLALVDVAIGVRAASVPTAQLNVMRMAPTESHAKARLVKRVTMFIGSSVDEPTLQGFGRAIGVSRGAFRNWCKTAGLKARTVRDFARALRAVWHVEHEATFELVDLLDIVDERTLRTFCRNCGSANAAGFPRTVEEFLRQQRLIQNSDFIESVRAALNSTGVEANALSHR